MHQEAFRYVAKIIGPLNVSGKRVLEIGSVDVNGSPRLLFAASDSYYGIDRRAGRGVDEVIEAADYTGTKPYDIVVSTEALEHTTTPQDIIDCAHRNLVDGGLFILTAAGPDRPEHDDDGHQRQSFNYTVLNTKVLKALFTDDQWTDVAIEYGESHGLKHGDIYAVATKVKTAAKAKKVAETKTDESVNA